MHTELQDVTQQVSTGRLPQWESVETIVDAAYRRYLPMADGSVADYIPVLARADPELWAVAVSEIGGGVHEAGDVAVEFTIQSISKAFVYALTARRTGIWQSVSASASTTRDCRSTR